MIIQRRKIAVYTGVATACEVGRPDPATIVVQVDPIDSAPVVEPPEWYNRSIAPTLADIASYKVASATEKWTNLVWGPAVWTEGTTRQDWLNVEYDPAVPAPSGGRDIIVYLHASGGQHDLDAASAFGVQTRARPIANGAVWIGAEVTHPHNNPGTPHHSFGRLFQAIRALAPLWGARTDTITIVARSRGNCGWWQAVQPDLINVGATKYVERQSSLIFAVYGLSSQAYYESVAAANAFVVPADAAAVAASDPNPYAYPFEPGKAPPDTGVLKNAAEDITSGTSPQAPWAFVQHEGTYWRRQVTADEFFNVAGTPGVPVGGWGTHHPDMGLAWRDAYRSRGWGHKIAYADESPGVDGPTYTEQARFLWPWLMALKEGANAIEAMAIAVASERGGALVYARSDLSGCYVNNDGTGGAPVAGGPVGRITDGSYGIANRASGTPLGFGSLVTSAANKPLLTALSGGQWGLTFDATDIVRTELPVPDGTVTIDVRCTDGTVSTTALTADASRITWGQPTLTGKVVGSVLAHNADPGAGAIAKDRKIMRTFAWWQMGTADA